ncbi:cysteine desulfurase [Marivirga atlantica]|jgi:cysteine desulfurase/selenocysteine lyase|uniref:Cysteine desulfurase n=1 Tax=Marivirga atlantica TaxID=1548457 RepID=A0A937DHQ9_9BACT|nr:cysteine desulfurase [Marivirga atlantica]MBL0766188.1 cysteine desulfurase [Marivirga atlantica]
MQVTETTFDINKIRADFPVLDQKVNGKQLVYFDNAATTQKPKAVIEAIKTYYEGYNANIHRGLHTLAEKATTAFEETRKTFQQFVNANEVEEIIFTKGTTDSINLVAHAYGRKFFKSGDEILISGMEHHSNIVPWQLLCEATGAQLKVIPVKEDGSISLADVEDLITDKTKLVSVVYASNSLGTINPVKEIAALAHKADAVMMVDGAQAASHCNVDVQDLDCDFFATSGHKMYGPTGTGILYGKRALLEAMTPYQGGGEMIKNVSFEETTYNDIPYKFEAGTPNIADIVALKEAADYISALGKDNIMVYEQELTKHAHQVMAEVPGIKFYGTAEEKVSVVSFTLETVHPYDVGMMLDAKGIAVRTGHHCTQPLMDHFGIEGTIRASFSVYNTKEEITQLAEGLKDIVSKFG